MRVVYADQVFFQNAAADYIILYMTARLAGVNLKRIRAGIASAAGGIYAAAAAIFLGPLSGTFSKIAFGALMAVFTFGGKRKMRMTLLFYAVSAAFAGAVTAAAAICGESMANMVYGGVPGRVFVLSFAVVCAVFYTVFGSSAEKSISGGITDITVYSGDKKVHMRALVDTGNTLRDPISGKKVTICTLDSASALLGTETVNIIRSCGDTLAAVEALRESKVKFRLIPYSSLGTNGGMVLAFSPDMVELNGRFFTDELVAVTDMNLGEGKGYAAITHAA